MVALSTSVVPASASHSWQWWAAPPFRLWQPGKVQPRSRSQIARRCLQVKVRVRRRQLKPTLSLEQVNGAIAFYLNHKDEVEEVMEERRRAEHAYIAALPTPPDIKAKFERMRRQMASLQS